MKPKHEKILAALLIGGGAFICSLSLTYLLIKLVLHAITLAA